MNLCRQLEKSFSKMERFFTKQELREFMAWDRQDLCRYHFGLGTWVRNYLLRDGKKLTVVFMRAGIGQKDEMSELLIQLFQIHARNKYDH